MTLPIIQPKKGFTLIELLIVIAIISILISIGMAAFSRAQAQARDGERKANIESIRGALEQHYADNNKYPGNTGALSPKYMRVVPKEPGGTTDFNYDATNSPYSPQYYCISTTLETDTSGSGCSGSGNYSRTARD